MDEAIPGSGGSAAPAAICGCMGLGGSWDVPEYGPAEIQQAEDLLSAALDAGFTWFDHADIYARGKAESVFGEVLSRSPDLRARLTLQTKCGIRLRDSDSVGRYDLRSGEIRRRVHASLERLRTDHVDVLLLHRPDALAEWAEVAEALVGLHAEGVVGRFGVSNMSAQQIAALQRHLPFPLIADQLEMSLHRRDWVEAGVLVNTAEAAENGFPLGTIEYCRDHDIQLQAWGPLAQGRYTGRQEAAEERATARLVSSLAQAKGTTPETIVLWWLQFHPARIAPVIGTTSPARIRACGDAITRRPELTREEWYELWVSARGKPLP